MYYSKFIKGILLVIYSPFLSLVAAIVIIDPLQVFHKNWIHPGKYYHPNFRLGALGAIKYADYDSIIIGSSLLQNTSSNETSKKLGGKFINLSIGGITLYERRRILDKLFYERKNIKTIIHTIEAYYLTIKDSPFIKFDDYGFLYSNDIHNNMNIYFSNINSLLDWIKYVDFISDLDKPATWYSGDLVKTFGGFHNWVSFYKETKNQWILSIFKAIKTVYKNKTSPIYTVNKLEVLERLEKDVVSLVEDQPYTKFHIVIPPYSKLFWKTGKSFFEDFKFAIRYLVKASSKNSNLYIHGFDNELFTHDISNYKDEDHFCPKINSFIIDAIRDKTHILTTKNIDSYLNQLEKDVENYDLKPFYDQIKDLEELKD